MTRSFPVRVRPYTRYRLGRFERVRRHSRRYPRRK